MVGIVRQDSPADPLAGPNGSSGNDAPPDFSSIGNDASSNGGPGGDYGPQIYTGGSLVYGIDQQQKDAAGPPEVNGHAITVERKVYDASSGKWVIAKVPVTDVQVLTGWDTVALPGSGPGGKFPGYDVQTPRAENWSTLVDRLSHMSNDQITDLQDSLWMGGFYKGTDPFSSPNAHAIVVNGRWTPETEAALWNAVMQGGGKMGLWDTIDQAVSINSDALSAFNPGKGGGGGGGGGGAQQPTLQLTDPATTREAATKYGQQLWGRNPTDDEKSTLVQFVQDLERQNFQEKLANAAAGGGGEITGLDEQARLQEQMRSMYPTETLGHDAASTFDMFTRLMSGPGYSAGVK